MSTPNGRLWKMSKIYEVNNFMSRKARIMIKIINIKSKGRKPVPFKWIFNSKKCPDGLIHLRTTNIVKVYILVPVVDYIELFFSVATDT